MVELAVEAYAEWCYQFNLALQARCQSCPAWQNPDRSIFEKHRDNPNDAVSEYIKQNNLVESPT